MRDFNQPIVVTEGEAARLLSVSRAALRRWRREGRGPEFTRLERCVRYKVRSIESWLEENSSGNKKADASQSACSAEGA
jgi:predicted site-specific integrase-resolvase